MTTIMMKKEYVTPAIEVFEFDAEESLLLSASNTTSDGEELSNKRKPVNNSPWDSSNWSTNE